MKSLRKVTWLVFCLCFLALPLWAQTNDPPVPPPTKSGIDWLQLLTLLTPVVVPVLVTLAKWAVDFLPKFTLPIIAVALGELLTYLTSIATNTEFSSFKGILLGAAGVGLREVIDQLNKANVARKAAKVTLLILFCLATPIGITTFTVAPLALTTGCIVPTSAKAKTYVSLKDVGIAVRRARDSYAEWVVLGKVSKADEAKFDALYADFQQAWFTAVTLARSDLSSITPDNVQRIADQIFLLLEKL